MVGMMARSKAGHDKMKIYIITKECGEYIYLSDGFLKPVAKPKKKSKKHVQIIKEPVNEELTERLLANETVRDEEIKRTIKLYEQSIERQI